MRITLNLATRPFTDLGPAMKRLRITMAVLALVSIALLLGLHALHEKAEAARAHEHSLDGAIARITGERQGYEAMMQRPDNARFMSQVETLNQLFDQKAFSWTLAMENLETVLPGGVQVTQIEPIRAKSGQITLHLRVLGPHDLAINLVRNLEHSKRFMMPRIIGENAEANTSGGPNRQLEPVSASNRFEFDLLADYNPPTPEERTAAKKGKAQTSTPGPIGNGSMRPHQIPSPKQRTGRQPYTGSNAGPAAAPPLPRPSPDNHPNPAQGGPQ